MQKLEGRLANEAKMIYRNLGNSGLKVSVLGFGNWVTGHDPEVLNIQREIVQKAWDAGVNFFDTAEVYGAGQAEKIFGDILNKLNADRSDLVITTKLFWGEDKTINKLGNSRKHLLEGIKKSLKNLQLDYVDVVFSHRPDMETPLKEVCKGFNDIIDQGHAHYWGTSEWLPEMIVRAIEICDRYGWHCPIAEQCQYSMLHREGVEQRYAYVFDEYKYGTTIWSPLCFGLLTGKYNDGIPKGSRFDKDESMKNRIFGKYFNDKTKEDTLQKLQQLSEIAKEKNVSMAQLALAWCVANNDTTVTLMGATKVSQIEDNLKSLELAKNWNEDLENKINKILGNAPETEKNFKTWQSYPERRSTTWKKI